MRTIDWQDQWDVGDVVVWVRVAAADRLWSIDDSYYIGPGAKSGKPIGVRYKDIGLWLAENKILWMSVAVIEKGVLLFTDGRHRFAWLRDHGARALPLATDPDSADEMTRLIGSRMRRTTYRL